MSKYSQYKLGTLKNLRILAATYLLDDLVVVLFAPIDGEVLVVPVLRRTEHVDVCVDLGVRHGLRRRRGRSCKRASIHSNFSSNTFRCASHIGGPGRFGIALVVF